MTGVTMASWQLFLFLLLVCIKGLCANCSAGEIPSAVSETFTTGRWALNDDHPSSCPGKLTQYEIYYYNDGGDVYLALWTPSGNNNYDLVEGSLKQVSVTSGGNRKKRAGTMTVTMDQFVYAPSGSVVGAYVPSINFLQVVGFVVLNYNYGICGNTINDETATKITCSSSGTFAEWSRLHVEADIETVDCGSLDSIPNGYVSLLDGSTLYVSVAVYQCNVTYILTGNEKRFCTQNATWNGTEPVCELFNCTVPSIVNGIIQGDSFSYGSSISYSCDEGYYLTGDSVITCGINMTWNTSQTPAECNPVNCGDPVNSNSISADGFTYQSVVTFNCTTGYNLIGSSSIECLSNGTWNNSLPVCEPVNCSDPGTPNNGLKNSTTFTYGTTIDFTCQSGYMLSTGYYPITCLADGSWSGATPDCIPVQCNDNPPTLVNGSFNQTSDNKYTFMTSVVYECDDGFILNGTSTITCLANRQWSGGAPECLRVCTDNFNFPNGDIDQSLAPFTVGVVIQLSCISGYQLNTGESVIQCLSSGEWNYTSTPECIEGNLQSKTLSQVIQSSNLSLKVVTSSLSSITLSTSSVVKSVNPNDKQSTTLTQKTNSPQKTITSTSSTPMTTTTCPSMSSSLSNQVQSSSDGLLNTNTLYIVIGVLAGLLILVMITIAITALLLFIKAKQKKSRSANLNEYPAPKTEGGAVIITRHEDIPFPAIQPASHTILNASNIATVQNVNAEGVIYMYTSVITDTDLPLTDRQPTLSGHTIPSTSTSVQNANIEGVVYASVINRPPEHGEYVVMASTSDIPTTSNPCYASINVNTTNGNSNTFDEYESMDGVHPPHNVQTANGTLDEHHHINDDVSDYEQMV